MPENVRDRDELLLNAIVTGDTSGIEPRDREETFIKAIAEKNTSVLIATSEYPRITMTTIPGTDEYDLIIDITVESAEGTEVFSGNEAIISNWDKIKTPVFVNTVGSGQHVGTYGNVLFIPIPMNSNEIEWIIINMISMTFSDIRISKYNGYIRLIVKQ